MTKPGWLIASLLLLGIGAYVYFSQGPYSSYVIEISGDAQIGFLVLVLSAMAAAAIAIWHRLRHRLQQRLQQRVAAQREQIRNDAAEERRRFLRRLDHELKNPLTAIHAGLARMTLDSEQPPIATHQNILQTVQTQTQRLSSVVGDLRKLADLESQPIAFDTMNLAVLLEDAFAQIQSQTSEEDNAQLQMRLTLPTAWPPLPEIQGDEDLLYLAVLNLLQNAVKFSQYTGNIELSAFVDGNRVIIKVADTGPGVPEAELDHVWDELYRSAQTQEMDGSGLGLAFVRTIVARHHGTVSMVSRPGAGTEVTMRLPISQG